MNESLITDEARAYKKYIEDKWGHLFRVELEMRMKDLLPEPTKKYLRSIWSLGSADVAVFNKRTDKLICILEPGGVQHYDEAQWKRDMRKEKLCNMNGVGCLKVMNGTMERVAKRTWRTLVGSFLFKK